MFTLLGPHHPGAIAGKFRPAIIFIIRSGLFVLNTAKIVFLNTQARALTWIQISLGSGVRPGRAHAGPVGEKVHT